MASSDLLRRISKKRTSSVRSLGSYKGENTKTLETLLSSDNAIRLQGALCLDAGRLQKVGGYREILTLSAPLKSPPVKFQGEYFVLLYGTKGAIWNRASGEVKEFKNGGNSDFNDDVLKGVSFLDWFYIVNGMGSFATVLRLTLSYKSVVSAFQSGERITGQTSGATAYVQNPSVIYELAFDGQTEDFTIVDESSNEAVLVGQTSGATAVITRVIDNYPTITTGTLYLKNIVGTFQNNETIICNKGGIAVANGIPTSSATDGTLELSQVIGAFQDGETIIGNISGEAVVNGAVGATASSVSVKGTGLSVIDNRLVVANGSGSGESNWGNIKVSEQYSGSGTPFSNYTAGGDWGDPYNMPFYQGGKINCLGKNGKQIIAFSEDGKKMWRNEQLAGGTDNAIQIQRTDFELFDYGGFSCVDTTFGVFYASKNGILRVVGGGEDKAQEEVITKNFSVEYLKKFNFDESQMEYDEKRKLVLCLCKKESSVNNCIIVYSVEMGAISEIEGVPFSFIGSQGGKLYATHRTNGRLFELFGDNVFDNDGKDIFFNVELPENNFGTNEYLKDVRDFRIVGKLAQGQPVRIRFHIWDENGNKVANYKVFDWTTDGVSEIEAQGVSQLPVGQGGYGGDIISETMGQFNVWLKDAWKFKIEIEENSKYPLEINEMNFGEITIGRKIFKNNLSKVQ